MSSCLWDSTAMASHTAVHTAASSTLSTRRAARVAASVLDSGVVAVWLHTRVRMAVASAIADVDLVDTAAETVGATWTVEERGRIRGDHTSADEDTPCTLRSLVASSSIVSSSSAFLLL